MSTAGFADVLRRLRRTEHNLDGGIERCRAAVERARLRLDLLAMAEVRSAREQLDGARRTGSERRAGEMLRDVDHTFEKYRNYYRALIVALGPATNPMISLPEAGEPYGRFLACAAARPGASGRPEGAKFGS